MRNRPGEEVGEVSRDERNVRRGRTIRGMTSRKIIIEDRSIMIGGVHGISESNMKMRLFIEILEFLQ